MEKKQSLISTTIILQSLGRAESWWPASWPVNQSSHSLQGLGYEATPTISAKSLQYRLAPHLRCKNYSGGGTDVQSC